MTMLGNDPGSALVVFKAALINYSPHEGLQKGLLGLSLQGAEPDGGAARAPGVPRHMKELSSGPISRSSASIILVMLHVSRTAPRVVGFAVIASY